MAYLVTGKILRSTEVKFEVAENKLSLLCMSKNTVVSSYSILVAIR